MAKTFWNNTHPLSPVAEQLDKLIPDMGEVENKKKNPKLEQYRQASNLYHEIFNNGCLNYARGASKFFDIVGSDLKRLCKLRRWGAIHAYTEVGMERIIREAAAEQGIKIEEAV